MLLVHLQIGGAKENVKVHKIYKNVNESVALQPSFANGNSSYLHRLTTVNIPPKQSLLSFTLYPWLVIKSKKIVILDDLALSIVLKDS